MRLHFTDLAPLHCHVVCRWWPCLLLFINNPLGGAYQLHALDEHSAITRSCARSWVPVGLHICHLPIEGRNVRSPSCFIFVELQPVLVLGIVLLSVLLLIQMSSLTTVPSLSSFRFSVLLLCAAFILPKHWDSWHKLCCQYGGSVLIEPPTLELPSIHTHFPALCRYRRFIAGSTHVSPIIN